jgi:hypothetical protein
MTIAESLRKEILDNYSSRLDQYENLSGKEKQMELDVVAKFLSYLVTDKGVQETLEIIEETNY